jgi:hypothetical protein
MSKQATNRYQHPRATPRSDTLAIQKSREPHEVFTLNRPQAVNPFAFQIPRKAREVSTVRLDGAG